MEKEETTEIAVIKYDFLPDTIDPKKEYLKEVAAEVAKIEADPAKMDKDTLELVNSTKNKLVKARTNIEKACKAARDPHTAYNRDVSAYEKELIEIIEPEEKRLKAIEVDAKKIAIKEERRLTLPEFKEKLAGIGDGIGIEEDGDTVQSDYDDFLLEMTPTQRDEYYNARLGEHLESEKKIADEAKEKEEAAKAADQKKIDDDKAEIARDKEKLVTEKINVRIQKLLSIGFRDEGTSYIYDEKLSIEKVGVANFESTPDEAFEKFINESVTYIKADEKVKKEEADKKQAAEVKAAEEKATEEAENKAKQDAADKETKRLADEKAAKEAKETKEKEVAAEKAAQEAKEGYQQWLNENSYNEATDMVSEKDGVYTLYRVIAKYDPESFKGESVI